MSLKIPTGKFSGFLMKTPSYLTDGVICSSLLPQHRGTHLLSRERVRLLVVALLAIEIIGFIFLVLGTHGWIVPLPKPTTTDFVSFYAAGHLANAGTPQLAY